MRKIIDLSPNISKRKRSKNQIKYVIIHYTGMQSEIESIKRLKNPKSKVSCHYLINKRGLITQMVNEENIAWHAGKSKWKKLIDLNSQSIGIELVNKGHKHGYENFSKLQIRSLIYVCKKIKKKYKIKRENFLGHSDIAPLRKIDPGEKFPWRKLSKFGLGVWYEKLKRKKRFLKKKSEKSIFFKNLNKIGYKYFDIKKRSVNDKFIIKSFQRRYNPKNVTGLIDEKTFEISQFLANYA